MWELLAQTIPLALVGAISPLALMGALVLLAGYRPLLRCGLFTAGVITMTAIFFAVVYVAMKLDLKGASGSQGLMSSTAAQVAIAAFLIVSAAFFFFRAPSPASQQKILERLNSPRIPTIAYFLVGIVMMWFSASFVVIIAIVHRMSIAGLPFHDNLVVLLVAVLITALPALVPFVSALVGGDRTRQLLERLGLWMTRNGRFILGALLLVLGLRNLVGAF